MNEQIPTIGRLVHYKLSAQDVEQIMRRRTTGSSIAERMRTPLIPAELLRSVGASAQDATAWPAGAQAHIGNDVKEGDVFPMLIVRTWGNTPESSVNGQVFLDGCDVYWATSRTVGDQPGQFTWPTRS